MDINIWDEKNLTDQLKKFENKVEKEQLDITSLINQKFAINEWKNITKQKISGIYKITNKINNKYYIGSSVDIIGKQGRFNNHIWKLIGNRHDNEHLQNAWNKYGIDVFVFEIIEIIDISKLISREQYYLDCITDKNLVYNISFIADRVEMTLNVKKKISINNKVSYLDLPLIYQV